MSYRPASVEQHDAAHQSHNRSAILIGIAFRYLTSRLVLPSASLSVGKQRVTNEQPGDGERGPKVAAPEVAGSNVSYSSCCLSHM